MKTPKYAKLIDVTTTSPGHYCVVAAKRDKWYYRNITAKTLVDAYYYSASGWKAAASKLYDMVFSGPRGPKVIC
jgi:hypothetical protein